MRYVRKTRMPSATST